MGERKFDENGGMEFDAILRNGKKYVCIDDLIAYLKENQVDYEESEAEYRIIHELIKAFVWCKNSK